MLDWNAHLIDGVLRPLQRGEPVRYRPPAWERFERPGAIEISAGVATLIMEGVGASRRSLRDEIDISVWVETPEPIRGARDDVRLAEGQMSSNDYRSWIAEENAHFLQDRPWTRAR